jgi:hypothetical protein
LGSSFIFHQPKIEIPPIDPESEELRGTFRVTGGRAHGMAGGAIFSESLPFSRLRDYIHIVIFSRVPPRRAPALWAKFLFWTRGFS